MTWRKLILNACRSDGSGFLSIGFQLRIDKMKTLHQYRQLNLIRYWMRVHALPEPGRDALEQFIETVLTQDKEFAELCWSDYRMYRYRDDLYLVRATEPALAPTKISWDLTQPLTLEQAGIKLVPQRFEKVGIECE